MLLSIKYVKLNKQGTICSANNALFYSCKLEMAIMSAHDMVRSWMGAIYTHSLSLQPYRGGNSISHSPENFIFIIMRLESRDGFYFSFIKEEREEREEKNQPREGDEMDARSRNGDWRNTPRHGRPGHLVLQVAETLSPARPSLHSENQRREGDEMDARSRNGDRHNTSRHGRPGHLVLQVAVTLSPARPSLHSAVHPSKNTTGSHVTSPWLQYTRRCEIFTAQLSHALPCLASLLPFRLPLVATLLGTP
jgi:hypothetical protein